jgi:Fe-Mn family superoxide dismutase
VNFKLPALPYDYAALEPHISAKTLDLHYSKHHQGYMDKLEKAIAGTDVADFDLEYLVRNTEGGVFNNAAQVWNHSFYWNSMVADGGGKPSGDLTARIQRDIGGLDAFKRHFAEIASGEFGSGWAWLVEGADGELKVLSTTDAENPMTDGYHPLLVLDVWEHAYYLDYQNRRNQYIEAFLDHLINWRFAQQNLDQRKERPKAASTAT